MSTVTDIKLGGIVIPSPNSFSIRTYNIEHSERTASGRLVKDIIAVKRTFLLKYLGLNATEKAVFNTLKEKQDFLILDYLEGGEVKTATVWMNELPAEMVTMNPEEWEDITIKLEEQ